MLSNLIVSSQKFVLIRDELGHDRISQKFITQILKEQGEDNYIKTFSLSSQLRDSTQIQRFLSECNVKPSEEDKSWNVVVPNLTDFLLYKKLSFIFQFLSKLKKCEYVKRIFLWISIPHLQHDRPQYVVAALEYMADMVLHFLSNNEFSLLVCKPGGGVTFKYYTYAKTKSEIKVQLKQKTDKIEAAQKGTNSPDSKNKTEQPGTFKIELGEDELTARNAIKLPYERATEDIETDIIYAPDAADNVDAEDPDEDLEL